MRVLLIEDNRTDAALFRYYLRKHAPESVCVHVPTLAEGIATVQEMPAHIDAIVLDLNLPDASGTESIRTLVRTSPLVPIVVLTGTDEFAEASRHLGARAYKLKTTVDGATLVDELRRIVEEEAHG